MPKYQSLISNSRAIFFSLALLPVTLAAQTTPASTGGIAISGDKQGEVALFHKGDELDLVPKQRLQTGDIVKLVQQGDLIEISYDNGCAEIINKVGTYKVDACRCTTSEFRKGKKDNFNATLVEMEGDVLVNQGAKYTPAYEDMRLRNGDRLMAMKNAKGKIRYDRGCVSSVESFSIHEVDSCSACPLPLEEPVRYAAQPANLLTNPGFLASAAAVTLFIRNDNDDDRAVSP